MMMMKKRRYIYWRFYYIIIKTIIILNGKETKKQQKWFKSEKSLYIVKLQKRIKNKTRTLDRLIIYMLNLGSRLYLLFSWVLFIACRDLTASIVAWKVRTFFENRNFVRIKCGFSVNQFLSVGNWSRQLHGISFTNRFTVFFYFMQAVSHCISYLSIPLIPQSNFSLHFENR